MNLTQAKKILELSLAEYSRVRADYYSAVYDAVYDFLSGKSSTTSYVNAFKTAMSAAVFETGTIAWQDGGAELPVDEEAFSVVQSTHNAELGNIDALFVRLLALRRSEDKDNIDLVAEQEASARAEGYCGTLDFLYSQIKLLAGNNKMLTFVGSDGKESCPECKRMKNKRHSAKWWVQHDLIPGSKNYSCGGWRCLHILIDDGGQVWTL